MTPEQLSRAIEPFYTTKEGWGGSGLGLSMVCNFCQESGGRLQLASEPGVGTLATIILPSYGVCDQEGAPVPEPTRAAVTEKGRILVVEDEERVRKLAARYLRDMGYDVLLAENGEKAIAVLQSESAIDLVFSDIAMPGKIDGDALCRWVQAQRPEIKVLLTTGLRSTEIRRRAAENELPLPIGLRKPYTMEQLSKALREVVST